MENKLLTLQDVVATLTEYDLKNVNSLYDSKGRELCGCVYPNERLIKINRDQFNVEKIYTMLHELIHADDIRKGLPSYERVTEQRTKALFKHLYGFDIAK